MGLPQECNGAWNADRRESAGRITPGQRLTLGGQQIIQLAALGSCLTSVQHLQRSMCRIPVQQETPTTKARALGFNHRQHCLGCDQGIDGCPPSLRADSAAALASGCAVTTTAVPEAVETGFASGSAGSGSFRLAGTAPAMATQIAKGTSAPIM